MAREDSQRVSHFESIDLGDNNSNNVNAYEVIDDDDAIGSTDSVIIRESVSSYK